MIFCPEPKLIGNPEDLRREKLERERAGEEDEAGSTERERRQKGERRGGITDRSHGQQGSRRQERRRRLQLRRGRQGTG